jgi:3-hydroxymyristoyl/3-hydroxydecanoyl-(acyl carrier protein) dehydratase
MPASAMIETMGQVAGCIFLSCHKPYVGKDFYLVGVDDAKFMKPVHIGDEIEIDVQVHPNREHIVVVDCMIRREYEKIASAKLMLWGTHE